MVALTLTFLDKGSFPMPLTVACLSQHPVQQKGFLVLWSKPPCVQSAHCSLVKCDLHLLHWGVLLSLCPSRFQQAVARSQGQSPRWRRKPRSASQKLDQLCWSCVNQVPSASPGTCCQALAGGWTSSCSSSFSPALSLSLSPPQSENPSAIPGETHYKEEERDLWKREMQGQWLQLVDWRQWKPGNSQREN